MINRKFVSKMYNKIISIEPFIRRNYLILRK
jgi:hypothetical protein